MTDKRKRLYFLIPPVLTVLILLIVYVIKGVYPFGSSNIAYYDMNQSFIPGYSRAYEVFNGKDSLFFDWLEGAGMDMTSTFPMFVLNPLNCFFWLLKPDYVLDFMAWFLMIKLVAISLSIAYYLKKEYALSLGLHVVLCLLYTFSGYILQFYTNIWWLDSVAVLPLLVLSLKRLMLKEKCDLYIILLLFELLTCQYMSIMVLIFVLFYSFGMAYTERDITKRRKLAVRIGISTALALAVSAVLLLPVVFKWSSSIRTSGSGMNLNAIFGFSISEFQHQKLFMLFNTELAIVLFGILIISLVLKKRKLSRETLFKLYIFFIMLMPALNEGINLLWHMGSYVHFPFRCAFILTFAGIDLIAYAWSECGDAPIFKIKLKYKQIIAGAITAMIVVAGMVIGINLYSTFIEYGIIGRTVSYYGLPELLILNVILYVLLICFFNKKIRERVFCIVTMIHLTVASVCFIAPTDYLRQDDFSYYALRDKNIHDSVNIRNSANLENDCLSRIKTLYPCLSRNYPMMLGSPSLNQWMNESTSAYFYEMISLGYDYNYTSNLDSGGTYFSDAVLNNKKVITYGNVDVPKNAYESYGKCDAYTIYDMKYALPFGMLVNERILDLDDRAESSDYNQIDNILKYVKETESVSYEHQMLLADVFSDNEIKLFTCINPEKTEFDETNNQDVYYYTLNQDFSSLLYISSLDTCIVLVNGEEVRFPYYDEDDNYKSRRNPQNTLNLIAGFEECQDTSVDIVVVSNANSRVNLVQLNLDAMAKLSEKYENSSVSYYEAADNRLNMTADVDGNNYLFLPLEYLDGWHAKVNGNEAEIIPVMNGAFMAVKLPDGHCEINMTFMPPTIIKGAVISLFGLAAAAVLFIMKKRGKDIAEIPWIARTASVCFNLVALTALVIMYILPVFI